MFFLHSLLPECIIYHDHDLFSNASKFNWVLLFIILTPQKQTYHQWHIDDFVEFINWLIEWLGY